MLLTQKRRQKSFQTWGCVSHSTVYSLYSGCSQQRSISFISSAHRLRTLLISLQNTRAITDFRPLGNLWAFWRKSLLYQHRTKSHVYCPELFLVFFNLPKIIQWYALLQSVCVSIADELSTFKGPQIYFFYLFRKNSYFFLKWHHKANYVLQINNYSDIDIQDVTEST